MEDVVMDVKKGDCCIGIINGVLVLGIFKKIFDFKICIFVDLCKFFLFYCKEVWRYKCIIVVIIVCN